MPREPQPRFPASAHVRETGGPSARQRILSWLLDEMPSGAVRPPGTAGAATWQHPASNVRLGQICFIVILLHLTLRVAIAARFPVLVEEAYYWQWSLFPSLGYVEHPPMVAWLILACRCLLGCSSPLVIRLAALGAGAIVHLLVYTLALQLFRDRLLAALSLIISLAMPGLAAMGILIVPDTPLLVFALLYLNLLAMAVRRNEFRWWPACGICLGLALLCKLSALLLPLATAIYLAVSRQDRTWLRRPGPSVALLAAAAVCSPYLVWVVHHGGDTPGVLLQSVRVEEWGFSLAKLGETLFEQMVMAGPLLFTPLAGCLLLGAGELSQHRRAFLFAQIHFAFPLAFFLLVGTFGETHPHWTALAYSTAAIALAALLECSHPWFRRVVGAALAVQIGVTTALACLTVVGIEQLQRIPADEAGGRLDQKLAAAQQSLFAWGDLARRVADAQEFVGPGEAFVFCDQRDTTSMLTWHGRPRPVANIGPLMPLSAARLTSQKHFVDYHRLIGQSGIFVTSTKWEIEHALRYLFEDVRESPSQTGGRAGEFRLFYVKRLRARAVVHFPRVNRQMSQLEEELTSAEYVARAEIDDRSFVEQLYEDVYGRTPREDEIAAWVSGGDALNRAKLAQMLITGPEFWTLRRTRGDQWIQAARRRARRRSLPEPRRRHPIATGVGRDEDNLAARKSAKP